MLDRESNKEQFAFKLYDVYCEAVGGKAWDGRPLPTSEEFFYDATKVKQADAWRAVAEFALTGSWTKKSQEKQASDLTKVQRYFPEPAYNLEGPTYFVGDIHGEFTRFNNYLQEQEAKGLTPGNLIILGDVGLGFMVPTFNINHKGTMINTTLLFQDFCMDVYKRGWVIYCVRGNHDNPDEWRGSSNTDAPGLPRMLRDNSVITIHGRTFYIAGGAVSVDKNRRVPGKSWWEGEELFVPVEAMKDMKGKIYGILSHTGPIPPNYDRGEPLPKNVLSDLEWERIQKDRLAHMQPKEWYFGHFHVTESFDLDDIKCKCLDIFDIHEFYIPGEEINN